MTQSSMAVALAGFSFMLTVIWGPPLIRVLRHFKVGKAIRVEGPERHFTKIGTPTMGGVMVIIPVALITILLNASSLFGVTLLGQSVLVPLAAMMLFAALGAVDDWAGLRGERKAKGLRARTKFTYQVILAVFIALALRYVLESPDMFLPGYPVVIRLGVWYVPIAAFWIVATSNAVNLTDGLDGLAGLISATAFAAYGGIALIQGQIFLARFCFTVVGAIFGFLWFNVHPALLFMGDTGSLSLGAVLAVVALMTGQWPLLPIIAIIPFSVEMSVVLQVAYFKWTGGRRLFKMAPLHHHFELSGWSETQVVQRFWLIGLLFAMIGVALSVV
ncbi:MAG: phospho-N-acetylmuramoyl-pentapeptide-transferase [Anaerolineales bacterium]|nr:phospho-N-acetylmuramoyl-pentapeptide-transferase [Anaerolineales bacterium]